MDFNVVTMKGSDIITIAFYRGSSQHWSSLFTPAAASKDGDCNSGMVVCPLKGASSTASPASFGGRSAEF